LADTNLILHHTNKQSGTAVETPTSTSSINKLLREAFAKVDLRDYEGALASMEAANILEPTNIYLDSLRRQLSEMLQLDRQGELDELTRHELIGPMPGMIECAMSESRKLQEARLNPPARPVTAFRPVDRRPGESRMAPLPEPSLSDSTAQKELEALKLLYFQRASKFVMNGDYEAALAEVQRVFEVDPSNTIAREYAAKVENLLGHARKLASPESDSAPAPVAPSIPPTADSPEARDSQRVTAWTEAFTQSRPGTPERNPQIEKPSVAKVLESQRGPRPVSQRVAAAPPSSRRPAAPPSQRAGTPPPSGRTQAPASQRKPSAEARQAVIYGDALNEILSVQPQQQPPMPDPEKRPRASFWVIVAFSLTALGAVGSYFYFAQDRNVSALNSTAMIEHRAAATMAQQQTEQFQAPVQNVSAAPEQPAGTPVQTAVETSHPQATAPEAVPPPAARRPAEKEPAPVTTSRNASQPAASPSLAGGDKIAPAPVKIVAQTDAAPAVPEFIPVEKDPAILKLVRPSYPSFVSGDGQVVVKVLIDAEGKPVETKILKSTNKALDAAAVDAVMRSQYSPAQMGHGPVTAWLTIPFKFRSAK
jgi:TonB family protein